MFLEPIKGRRRRRRKSWQYFKCFAFHFFLLLSKKDVKCISLVMSKGVAKQIFKENFFFLFLL